MQPIPFLDTILKGGSKTIKVRNPLASLHTGGAVISLPSTGTDLGRTIVPLYLDFAITYITSPQSSSLFPKARSFLKDASGLISTLKSKPTLTLSTLIVGSDTFNLMTALSVYQALLQYSVFDYSTKMQLLPASIYSILPKISVTSDTILKTISTAITPLMNPSPNSPMPNPDSISILTSTINASGPSFSMGGGNKGTRKVKRHS